MAATSVFGVRDYRHLFGAQVVALAGNGLATVALGLLAFQLAGPNAAAVLGTALTIKMVVYVVVAPIAAAYAGRFDRRRLLVTLDLIRAAVVIALPFADRVWHVLALVALMQAASAAFTPTFQAVLPDILPEEAQYTRALSYSQLASTMETLLSPLLAAVLISVIDFHWLFAGTAVGFVGSAVLVLSSRIPTVETVVDYRAADRVLSGVRIFLATPRLRGLLGLDLAVAGVGSIIMVNTVNLVQETLGRPQADVAWLLTANGAGVLVVALAVPRLVGRHGDRTVMVAGAVVLSAIGCAVVALSLAPAGDWQWPALAVMWACIGVGTGAVLTPVGNVLRRSSAPQDRPAVFAAQFSLSHACWLLAYPIAGWAATTAGYPVTWSILAGLTAVGTVVALRMWPSNEHDEIEHVHAADSADIDHVRDAELTPDGYRHSHEYVIDRLHSSWPDSSRSII